jgi:hypothetical protein
LNPLASISEGKISSIPKKEGNFSTSSNPKKEGNFSTSSILKKEGKLFDC